MEISILLLFLFNFCVDSYFPPNILDHGTQIHFLKPPDGSIQQMSSAYSTVRRDIMWNDVEKKNGVYDFSEYDVLINDLLSSSMRPYMILRGCASVRCGNNTYPSTQYEIDAFVNYSVATVEHYVNQGIIFELWNEPDVEWSGLNQNATAYSIIANAVGNAIRSNSKIKNEIFVGPACGEIKGIINFAFLQKIFEMGVLKYFDAVSAHPYMPMPPEHVISQYRNLSQMIVKYNTFNKSNYIPIITSEFGYSTCIDLKTGYSMTCNGGAWTGNATEYEQAIYIVRQWFINNFMNVSVSIIYDYRNDGTNQTSGEDNFGSCKHQYYNSTIPYVPKIAYYAQQTYQKYFRKYSDQSVWNRLSGNDISCDSCNSSNVYVIGPQNDVLSVWYVNDGNENMKVNVTVHNMNFGQEICLSMIDVLGNGIGKCCSDNNGDSIHISNVSGSPIYLFPSN